ncbi:MAG: transcriptional regulator domain-containing protein [Alphaproteobacteria bacterium]
MSKSNRELLFQEALKELEPRWKYFDELEIFQWAWEFLRRNEVYRKILFRLSDVAENSEIYERYLKIILYKFGLTVPLCPSQEMEKDLYWNYELVPKSYSDYRLNQAIAKNKTITGFHLFDDEELMLINFNAPCQAYKEELERRYKEKQKITPLPQFQVSKFPELIKMHDLRTWGETGRRAIKKDGVLTSCISWAMIGQYLSPKTPYTAQMLRKRFETVEDYINGNYMELLRYKGAFKNIP